MCFAPFLCRVLCSSIWAAVCVLIGGGVLEGGHALSCRAHCHADGHLKESFGSTYTTCLYARVHVRVCPHKARPCTNFFVSIFFSFFFLFYYSSLFFFYFLLLPFFFFYFFFLSFFSPSSSSFIFISPSSLFFYSSSYFFIPPSFSFLPPPSFFFLVRFLALGLILPYLPCVTCRPCFLALVEKCLSK